MSADQTSIRLRPIPTSSTEDLEHLEGSTTTTTTATRNNRPPTTMERLKNFLTPVKATDEEYEPLTDDTSSTLTVEGETFEETPFSWIEYFIFVLIGVAMLWAWYVDDALSTDLSQ